MKNLLPQEAAEEPQTLPQIQMAHRQRIRRILVHERRHRQIHLRMKEHFLLLRRPSRKKMERWLKSKTKKEFHQTFQKGLRRLRLFPLEEMWWQSSKIRRHHQIQVRNEELYSALVLHLVCDSGWVAGSLQATDYRHPQSQRRQMGLPQTEQRELAESHSQQRERKTTQRLTQSAEQKPKLMTKLAERQKLQKNQTAQQTSLTGETETTTRKIRRERPLSRWRKRTTVCSHCLQAEWSIHERNRQAAEGAPEISNLLAQLKQQQQPTQKTS